MDFCKAAPEDKLFWRCLSISLFASPIRITMAAKARRHGGHPDASGSSRLDKYAIGHCLGLTICVGTTPPKRLKSCGTSGSPNPGALVKSPFISLKAASCLEP